MARHRWKGSFHLGIVVASSLLVAAATAAATDFSFESSFPAIFFEAPADLSLEGSVTVSATARDPVVLLDDPDWLEQTGELTWTTVFRWNEPQARVARFEDAAGDTVAVTFAPSPRMPLDFARHQLPVLRLTTAPANLWDPETGIYAWGYHDNFLQRGQEWERPATLDYFTADGTLVFSEPVGVRINGESSRTYVQKGLRLYFDDYGTSDHVEHDFFGDGPVRCERLILRGSAFPDFAIGSGWAEPLHRDLGNPGSRYSYVAVYLNDEYWGAYALRERYDSKWVETTHDWADDDYLVIKDHEAEAGDYQQWVDFLDDVAAGDPASHDWFVWFSGQFDLESYVDWLLVNAMGHTADNMHGKNLAIVKVGGDPYRFMAWDEDILFQSGNRMADHLMFYASSNLAEFNLYRPGTWFSGGPYEFTFQWNALLNRGMRNAEFKDRFRRRSAELLAGPMSLEALLDRVDALAAVQQPEWAHHQVRWEPSGTYAYRLLTTRAGLTVRHGVLSGLIDDFLDHFAEPAEVIAFSVVDSPGQATLDWRTAREQDCVGWLVERSLDDPHAFEVLAGYLDDGTLVAQGGPDLPAEYTWTDTSLPDGREAFYRLSYVTTLGLIRVVPWVERVGPGPEFDLRLNEFMAANQSTVADEAGEFDDWLEIYNTGDADVPLSGLFLTDNLDWPTKWALPDLTLAAGQFLLVWCDEDPEQGPLHASFKLSAGGEEIGLFAGHAAGLAPIDTLSFGPQQDDVSCGRLPDGTGAWTVLDVASPGASNNSQVAVDDSAPASVLRLAPARPNPTSSGLQISGRVPHEAGRPELAVYTVRGALVRQLQAERRVGDQCHWSWDGRDTSGRPAAGGVYLLRVEAGAAVSQQRVVLIR